MYLSRLVPGAPLFCCSNREGHSIPNSFLVKPTNGKVQTWGSPRETTTVKTRHLERGPTMSSAKLPPLPNPSKYFKYKRQHRFRRHVPSPAEDRDHVPLLLLSITRRWNWRVSSRLVDLLQKRFGLRRANVQPTCLTENVLLNPISRAKNLIEILHEGVILRLHFSHPFAHM